VDHSNDATFVVEKEPEDNEGKTKAHRETDQPDPRVSLESGEHRYLDLNAPLMLLPALKVKSVTISG